MLYKEWVDFKQYLFILIELEKVVVKQILVSYFFVSIHVFEWLACYDMAQNICSRQDDKGMLN